MENKRWNGERHGTWRWYYGSSGLISLDKDDSENEKSLYIECNYIHSKLHGVSKQWYNNGKIWIEEHFLNGNKEGEDIHYFYKEIFIHL